MHDYDRRPRDASSEVKVHNDVLYEIDAEKIAEVALRFGYGARADVVKEPKQVGTNGLVIKGTTADGRAFQIEVTFFIKDLVMEYETRTTLEGDVAVGPVPDVLLRMEASVVKILDIFKAVGVPERDLREFTSHFSQHVQSKLEMWRGGEFVDAKFLRTSIKMTVKKFDDVRSGLSGDLRTTIPPGETQPLWKLVDATRKAIGAAARSA